MLMMMEEYNLSQINGKPTPPPPGGGFILDSVQNCCSCVRTMLFQNTVSVGLKLIPRLTAAWLAQLGERRSAKGRY